MNAPEVQAGLILKGESKKTPQTAKEAGEREAESDALHEQT